MIDYSQSAIPKGLSRFDSKLRRAQKKLRKLQKVYAAVSERDECCRVCGMAGWLLTFHHHHIIYRSRGGKDTTANLCLLCYLCHGRLHDGKIRLSGNANERNELGKLAGLKVEVPHEEGWKIERFV